MQHTDYHPNWRLRRAWRGHPSDETELFLITETYLSQLREVQRDALSGRESPAAVFEAAVELHRRYRGEVQEAAAEEWAAPLSWGLGSLEWWFHSSQPSVPDFDGAVDRVTAAVALWMDSIASPSAVTVNSLLPMAASGVLAIKFAYDLRPWQRALGEIAEVKKAYGRAASGLDEYVAWRDRPSSRQRRLEQDVGYRFASTKLTYTALVFSKELTDARSRDKVTVEQTFAMYSLAMRFEQELALDLLTRRDIAEALLMGTFDANQLDALLVSGLDDDTGAIVDSQTDETGLPVLAKLAFLLGSSLDAEGTTNWLTRPRSILDGFSPVEAIDRDPDGAWRRLKNRAVNLRG